ncbi:2-(1,2-epoxy-1,2-dihydrophenyl)acetyl-CoA isomerase [Pseudoduganella lurida]|uniref:2-(1,2-epoxy-1,2-dihydrophenyl)acetyl-CoA isomerase n=1 Tax=Pseudoduganella lurida TaxID=1036180 RepID=A0A562RCU2_9BURK|nr:2-(1,2-epoxy-1,2-dihydrophenyl)acetyl-CoA isomerase PaaG [Pseudoduganella lurida]TWI66260.1 2-(1,2-epoxy-1,2-dihydrophenyl)acetyl-CoA isomerase [Pseudoduganella lurida]
MTYENIEFGIHAGIAKLTLNRPDKLNSFTQAMHLEVRAAFDQIRADGTVRVLLITGAGRGFCAGQDLSDRAVAPGSAPVDLGDSVERFYAPLVLAIRTLPMPVICAVNGVAAGAGASIALACDIVLAAQSASFVQAFCRLGLVPDTGGTWHLPRLIGHARATGLAMLGEKLTADRAEEWGLIWKALPDDALQAEALAMAQHFAGAPTLGLAYTKRALQQSWSNTLPEQLALEGQMMRELGSSHDYREGVDAFVNKRTPHFRGA